MAGDRSIKHAISHLQTPPLPLALALPPARLPIAPLFPRLLRLMICFLRHRPWHDSLNAETSSTTSCTKPPNPVPSHTTPPPPPSSETVLPTPPPPSSALVPASISLAPLPNLCLLTSSIPPASYHFTHRYPHALRPPPLSSASTAPLAVISTIPATPSLSRLISLACKAPKTPPQGASMQSSRDDKYEPP
jgi:hypothetical protein